MFLKNEENIFDDGRKERARERGEGARRDHRAKIQFGDPFFPHDGGEDENERDRGENVPDADVEGAVHAVSPVKDDERRQRELAEMIRKIAAHSSPDPDSAAAPVPHRSFDGPP